MSALFRQEALEAQQTRSLGEIILIRPVSLTLLSMLAGAVAVVIISFLTFGTYTARSTVSGQLVLSSGLIKVYVPQPGVVLERHVAEGDTVHAGDVLFVLSSERQSSTQGETQATISKQIAERQASLRDDLERTRLVQQSESESLIATIRGLQGEERNLAEQIDVQKKRLALANETVRRSRDLSDQGYISEEALEQKQADQLDQRGRLDNLERNRISIEREIIARQSDLGGMLSKHRIELGQIDRQLSSTSEEFTESEAKRRLVITAPTTGTATAVIANVGQAVDPERPMVSIVPSGSTLYAELFAPSRAIGFVRPGDKVRLRYQAYPYQKFGTQMGVVESVARTALPKGELSTAAGGANGNAEALYRIRVELAAQTVKARGKAQPLQPGMQLDADLMGESQHLYEWILDPLYSISGRT
jgi:membrane fusion protein